MRVSVFDQRFPFSSVCRKLNSTPFNTIVPLLSVSSEEDGEIVMTIKPVRALFTLVLTGMLLLPLSVSAADTTKLSTAWMGEYETFITWYVRQQGWDKAAGYDISMMPFDSGKGIVDSLAAYNWDIAGVGAVPALTEPLGEHLTIMAVATDESAANAVYARKDSAIAKASGANAQFPAVRGSADTVKKATVLVPRATSAHYLLQHWLRTLGLTEKDVKVEYMEPTQALSAFIGGVGDVVVLWAPQTFEADAKGFVPVATGKDCGLTQTVLLVVNSQFAAEHPDRVEGFLKLYQRGVDAVRNTSADVLAKDFQRFYKDWMGVELTLAQAATDIRQHRLFSLDEQLAFFREENGTSPLMGNLRDVVEFSIAHGSYTPAQQERLRDFRLSDAVLKKLP